MRKKKVFNPVLNAVTSDGSKQVAARRTPSQRRAWRRMRAAQRKNDPEAGSKSSEPPPITDHPSGQKASSNSATVHLTNTRKPMLVHPMPWKLTPITLPHIVPFTHAGAEDPWEMSVGDISDNCTQSEVEKLRENFKKFLLLLEEQERSQKLTDTVSVQLKKPVKKVIANPIVTKQLAQGSEVAFSEVRTAAVGFQTKPNSQATKSSEKSQKIVVSESSDERKHSINTKVKKVHGHSKLEVKERSHKLTATINVDRKLSKKDCVIPVTPKPIVKSSEFNFSEARNTSVSLDAKPTSQPTKTPEKKQKVSTSESVSPRKVHVGQATAKQLEVLRNIRCGKKFYVNGNSSSVSPKVSPQKDFTTKQTHKLEELTEKIVSKTFALGKKVATSNLLGKSPSKKVPSKLLSTKQLPKPQEKSASKIIDNVKSTVTVVSEAGTHKNFLSKQERTKPLLKSPKMSFKQRLEKSVTLEGGLVKDAAEQGPTKPVGITWNMSYYTRCDEIVNIDVSPTKVFPSTKVSTKPLVKSRKVSYLNQKISEGENAAQLNLTRPANVYPAKKPPIKSMGSSKISSINRSLTEGKYSVSDDNEINPAKEGQTKEVLSQNISTLALSGKRKTKNSEALNPKKRVKKDVSSKSAAPMEKSVRKKRQKMSIDESFSEVEKCLNIETSPSKNVRVDRTKTTPLKKSQERTSGLRLDEEMQDYLSKRLPTRPAKMSRKISASGRLDEGRSSFSENNEEQNPSEVVAKQASKEPLKKQQSTLINCFDNNCKDAASLNVEKTARIEMTFSIKKCEEAQYIKDIFRNMQEVRSFRSLVDLHDDLTDLESELERDLDICYKEFVEKYNVIPNY